MKYVLPSKICLTSSTEIFRLLNPSINGELYCSLSLSGAESIILFPNTHVFDLTGRLAYIYQIGHPYMNIINPFLFVFLYLAIVFLFGIIITNLGIILTRFIKKFNLLVIGNFILVIIIESIGNFIVGPIVKSLTGYDRMANGFSLYNIYYLDAIPSLWWEFLFSIITIIITSIIIYLIYKDKEKVLNSYE